MTFKIEDRDKGYRRTLNALGPLGRVTLGVMGQDADQPHKDASRTPAEPEGGPTQERTPITIGEIAYIHELGLGVPERSWLRAWIDENQETILRDSSDALKQVILGKLTRARALAILGLKWSAAIKTRISDGQITPELSKETIKRKGSSVPLIDTGQLRSAITYLAEVNPSLVASLVLDR